MTRLAIVVVLLALGVLGMLRGSLPSDVRVEGGGAPSPRIASTAPYLPEPQPGLSRALAPGEHWKAPPVAAIHALTAVAPERELDAIRIVTCESGWDTTVVGAAGEEGAAQVMARFWGPVPRDLYGQLAQADRIMAEHGMLPWTTRDGCPSWGAGW